MKLTTLQKESLAEHIAKKPIKYIELYNELYDHYATACEEGDKSFEVTLAILDDQFNDDEVKAINKRLYKKTKKSVSSIYWMELKNFWRWPKIVGTLTFIIFGFALTELFAIKSIIWYVIIPILILNAGIILYGLYLSRNKLYGNKKFQSAHLDVSHFYLSFPMHFFNLSILIPTIFKDFEALGINFFEQYPLIIFILMILINTSAIVGWKVFKSKIKVQYL